ncbi:MAG: NAD(P)H-dependent oxidoreductase [Pseudomonadales bacterium]|jgi:FMN-dependent NADH-azoreductase|nr:NAD(P)H-dependent oxidoreductase [Pseudomonadales bacterium]
MSHLLHMRTSLFGQGGQSSRLADAFVDAWCAHHTPDQVSVRDLAAEPVPHLDAAGFLAFGQPDGELTAAQRATLERSQRFIEELRAADVVVLGLPMYNLGVPSTLKAWFDHVARAGITFRYTETGPRGLLADRPVFVLAARGGLYEGTDRDLQTPYVRQFFALIGIEDLRFVYAEGLAVSETYRDAALEEARVRIRELVDAGP